MVKISFWEELAINVVVIVIMVFFIRNYMNTTSWTILAWIIALIVYAGITNIIIKLIKGKDHEKEEAKEANKTKSWWKKQKGWEKVIIILGAIVIVIMLWNWIFGSSAFDAGNYAKENFEKLVTEDLSDYGYEVISVGKMDDYVDKNKSWVYVNMKSLGDINQQAWEGFISLGSHSSVAGFNVGRYSVSILTPTNECYYAIDGNLWNNYKASAHGDKIYYVNGTEANGLVAYNNIDYIIKTETNRCLGK